MIINHIFVQSNIGSGQGTEPYNNFYYSLEDVGDGGEEIALDFGNMFYQEGIKGDQGANDSIFTQVLSIFKLDIGYDGDQKALYYIKYLLNYLLGFVSLILLVLILYAFYLYMIGSDENSFGKVKNTLKVLIIVVLVLGLSRFIVSFMFNIYEKQLYSDPALAYLVFNVLI